MPREHALSQVENLYFEDEFTTMKTRIDYVNRVLAHNDSQKYQVPITLLTQIQSDFNQLK
jgi:hypothetical protein